MLGLGGVEVSLSRQDVFLGRALLAWGLVDRARLLECTEEVRRYMAQGHPMTLGQVLVRRGLLTPAYYQAIVQRLRQLYVEQGGAAGPAGQAQLQRATEQMPELNESGRYMRQQPQPPPPPRGPGRSPDTRTIERAVQGWQQVAPQVTASGSQIEIEFDFDSRPSTSPRPAPAPTPAPAPAGRDRRQGPDAAIRRRLKVPPEQERFAVGAWTVEQYLADGAQGVVYRVTRQGGDATAFALKVLKQHEPKPEVRQRFVQEARTMAKLTHPGIVHVHDAGVASGLLWYVMDFLPGPTLKAVLEEQGALPCAEGLRVIARLCEAVAHAHGHGVLHRDLKPENVIVADGAPVLTDFGLAKDTQSTLNLTAEGQRIGTPLYMAPELLLDAEKATPQSEVYALGAMLYQVLTGKVPFFAKSVIDLAELIESGKFTPLRELCAEASKGLEQLCARALHKDPSKRPQTVEELARELARAS